METAPVTGPVRVVTYNIRQGGRGRTGQLAAVLRHSRAHLALLQEASDPGVVAELADALGMQICIFRAGQSAAALSSLSVRDWRWHRVATGGRDFLEVHVEELGWSVFAVHLSPSWWWRGNRREREVEALLELAGRGDEEEHEVLLAGDFNAIAPGDDLQWAGMPLRVRGPAYLSGGSASRSAIGAVLAAGYCDAAQYGETASAGLTLPACRPQVRLDYVFASSTLACRIGACQVVDGVAEARTASDHLAVMAQFEMS
jgi:exodeoxyribonuclease-3